MIGSPSRTRAVDPVDRRSAATNSSFSPRAYAALDRLDRATRPAPRPRGRSRRSRARSAPSAGRGPWRSSGRRPSRCARPGGPRRGGARGRRRSRCAERGGVSRPSSSAWTRTDGDAPSRGQLGERDEMPVVGVDAAGADQADEVQPAVRPGRRDRRPRASAGRSKNEPSAIAASIRGRSWRTGRPAPRLRWPTSELPIWPGGRPTASSDAREAARAARRRAGRARPASVRRRSRRPPGRARCRSRRGRRGRSAAAGVRSRQSASVTERGHGTRVSGAGRGGHAGAGDDAGHLVGLQRRAADERAVDRGLGQELADVRRGDAAAVQHRQAVGAAAPQPADCDGVRGSRRPSRPHPRRVALRPVPIAQTGS